MKPYLTIVLAVLITACGGGGSSGGAGGGNQSYAGSYIGTATITMSAPGRASVTESFPITVEIDGNGTVRIIDSEGTFSTGRLEGNRFTIHDPFVSATENGVTCAGPQTFDGEVTGDTVNGRITANFNCSGFGQTVTVSVTGTFTATAARAADALTAPGGGEAGLMGSVHRFVNP